MYIYILQYFINIYYIYLIYIYLIYTLYKHIYFYILNKNTFLFLRNISVVLHNLLH